MDSQAYAISDAFIKKTKRTYLCMYIFIPIGIFLMAALLLFADGDTDNLSLFIGIFIGITAFVEIELLIVSKIMLKKVKENTLTIGSDFLQRSGKKAEDPIAFQHIQKLYIKKEAIGTIAYINIQTSTKTIRLCGFENLEEIADLLKATSVNASIKESQYKLDYNHPVMFALIFFFSLAVFYLFNANLSLPLSDLVCLGMGIWFLLFKPVSKAQGKRFRLFEIIVGALIVLGIGMQYLSMLLG